MKSPRDLIRHIADHFGTTPAQLTSPRKEQRLAEIRGGIMVALRDYGRHSFPQIARIVGRANHTTAMHWVRLANDGGMEQRPAFAEAYRSAAAFLGVDPWERDVPPPPSPPKTEAAPVTPPASQISTRKIAYAAKFTSRRAQSVHRAIAEQAERQARIRAMEYGE